MPALVAAAGALLQAATWRLIAVRRIGFWQATSVTFAIVGAAAVWVRPPGSLDAMALVIGTGSGVVLYLATRVVVGLLGSVKPFASSVTEVYGRSAEIPTGAVWVLTLIVAVPGEELFWRGLVVPELQDATSLVIGAFLAWLGYVTVNALSRNLAILVAAVVGGAWWTVLGSFEHVAAPIASHLTWTGLMLAWPPRAGRAKVSA
jgi:membrane protease YdiL (CAAX protease family)